MIDPAAKLSVIRQTNILGISRGSVYYKPRPVSDGVSDADLKLIHRIDKLQMEFPFAGSRMLQGLLVQEGFKVGRLHVATLMKRPGRAGEHHGFQRTREGGPLPSAEHLETGTGAQDFPPLLRKLPITRPNQVWAMDITYIPMARGFIYLAAVPDWFTRRVLAWRVSITLEADFCMEAVEEALARHGTPEIFNTDQGSQFTSTDFIKVLAAREIKISMDGKGAWRDNVFVERLWRTIKYEEVHLRAYMDLPREHWTQIASTNPLERVNREIKRRADVVGIFPNDGAIVRLVGALMLETNCERAVARRYMSLETLARVTDNPTVRLPAVAT